MTSISSLEDDFEHLSFPTQIDFCSNSPVNRALTHVAQEIAIPYFSSGQHQTR